MDAVLVANIKQSLSTLVTKLLTAVANPRPNYEVEGQKFSFSDYLKNLLEGIKTLMELLTMVEPMYTVTGLI